MDVTPETLHDVEFREAKRGYHTGDVDDFLEKLAVGVEALQAELVTTRTRLAETEARLADTEARSERAERRAAEVGDTDETLKRTLVLAQRTADAAIAEAEEQAARAVSTAEDQANRMLAEAHDAVGRARAEAEAEARRAEEETRASVLAELRALEDHRDQLRTEVDAHEHFVEQQRSHVRAAVAGLQRLLDDPRSLGEPATPWVSDPFPERPRPLVADPTPADGGELLDPGAAFVEDDVEAADVGSFEPVPETDLDLDVDPDPDEDLDPGPPTQPVDVLAERDAGDDAYLAELRKAMTDDTPLGPREEPDLPDSSALFSSGSDRPGRSRFGRRG